MLGLGATASSAQELFLPALIPDSVWGTTDIWEARDQILVVLVHSKSANHCTITLAPFLLALYKVLMQTI